MIKKLYVGGLSFNTTDETLTASFAQAGTVVSAIVIKDKFSGRSKGFGFVEMNSEEEATLPSKCGTIKIWMAEP
jgi:RNA recognition motif-containing protein